MIAEGASIWQSWLFAMQPEVHAALWNFSAHSKAAGKILPLPVAGTAAQIPASDGGVHFQNLRQRGECLYSMTLLLIDPSASLLTFRHTVVLSTEA